MSQALSLHIGVNAIDPAHYGGTGDLAGCENDARDMALMARQQGFTLLRAPLLTKDATAANVTLAIKKAAAALARGGTFFITYAGHGAQVPDKSGDGEKDDLDETWCLYDRMLLDDELSVLWAGFKPGVRIVVLSDSCHSGTVTRALLKDKAGRPIRRFRQLSRKSANALYVRHQAMYDAIQLGIRKHSPVQIKASVLLISGCQDNQLSGDGDVNGLFTETLKDVWGNGVFSGTYKTLRADIVALMPPQQQPCYTFEGAPNPALESEQPFSPSGSAGSKKKKKAPASATPAARPKVETPLAFILARLKFNGLAKPTSTSDLRAWVKRVEKEDAKMGLPATRADAFLASCFDRFPKLPLQKEDITTGKVRTPKDLVARLDLHRRSRGGNDEVPSFSGVDNLVVNVTKDEFLAMNKVALDKIITAVNGKLTTAYGAAASVLTRQDLCVVFYCECGLQNGKVDANHTHSEGERGMLPLPSNIKSWNGSSAPAWNQAMSPVINAEHFFLYMGHLKNKDLTGAPRHLYRGLFQIDGIRGKATIGAKLLAGVVHGYFYRPNYTDNVVPFDHLIKSYKEDAKLSTFMASTKYRHAGTSVLTGRERNIDKGLSLA